MKIAGMDVVFAGRRNIRMAHPGLDLIERSTVIPGIVGCRRPQRMYIATPYLVQNANGFGIAHNDFIDRSAAQRLIGQS
jgi:hypothetical protein